MLVYFFLCPRLERKPPEGRAVSFMAQPWTVYIWYIAGTHMPVARTSPSTVLWEVCSLLAIVTPRPAG